MGTPYVPHTLEAEGPEHLVIDFREPRLRDVRGDRASRSPASSASPARPRSCGDRGRGRGSLRAAARGAPLPGRAPRRAIRAGSTTSATGSPTTRGRGSCATSTEELGGVPDTEPIDFMSTHVDAYRQLADTANLAAIRAPRSALPRRAAGTSRRTGIAAVADRIQDGDIIAATSTVKGLDVAHTGIALWIGRRAAPPARAAGGRLGADQRRVPRRADPADRRAGRHHGGAPLGRAGR